MSTEVGVMTPERFHDFLSLASSPPLRSSTPPRPLDTPTKNDNSQVEREEMKSDDGEQCDSVSAAPSFAQVRMNNVHYGYQY